jgi:hypothetical protein
VITGRAARHKTDFFKAVDRWMRLNGISRRHRSTIRRHLSNINSVSFAYAVSVGGSECLESAQWSRSSLCRADVALMPLNAFSRPGRGIGEIGGNPAFTSVNVLSSHAMTSSALAIIAFRVGAQAFAGDQS